MLARFSILDNNRPRTDYDASADARQHECPDGMVLVPQATAVHLGCWHVSEDELRRSTFKHFAWIGWRSAGLVIARALMLANAAPRLPATRRRHASGGLHRRTRRRAGVCIRRQEASDGTRSGIRGGRARLQPVVVGSKFQWPHSSMMNGACWNEGKRRVSIRHSRSTPQCRGMNCLVGTFPSPTRKNA